MSSLRWSIKDSLLDYVRSMPDGSVVADEGAREVDGNFEFAATGDALRFAGRVTLTGHNGLMRVRIADPAIVKTATGWLLQIADPDDPASRISFATLQTFDGSTATGAALTEVGADLFFGPYTQGTAIDPPRIGG